MLASQQLILNLVFQALADPTRRGVLERLGRGSASVSELAEPYAMALPSFVQHIKALEQSGLIHTEKRGRVRTCRIAPQAMTEAEDWLVSQRRLWDTRLDQLDTYLAKMAELEDTDER